MVKEQDILSLIRSASLTNDVLAISEKVLSSQRISEDEALKLYESFDLGLLGILANFVRRKKNDDKTFFNKNIHIEPTNVCINKCRFCSYSRQKNQEGSWEFTVEEIVARAKDYASKEITEVHIVGGVHPDRDIEFYCRLITEVKKTLPGVYVKAFTAVELDYMISKAGLTVSEGLKILKNAGLDSIPGGGAEIFDEEIRKYICDEKASSSMWLNIHEEAHKIGIPTNATMLYGHIEKYSHRVDHLNRLRNLQDKTGMFQAFIPLKFRNKNNEMSSMKEVTYIEDLKNYAVSRIFLDNFQHIKAYWPMIGKDITQLSLSFGVDDIDGTIDDSTKIYSMAGSEEQKPSLSTKEMVKLINDAGKIAVERDTLYNEINKYNVEENLNKN